MKNALCLVAFLTIFATMNAAPLPPNFEKLAIDATADSLKISVLVAMPAQTPRAIVQLVHGMCEYKERYIPFMQFLTEQGYVVVIHDHRGHGQSVKSADDLGYFYEGGYKAAIDDAHAVTELIKARYPSLPLYLFGHSMGSMIVRSYAKRYDHELAGLIVCGCPSYNVGSSIGQRVAARAAKQHGDHYRSAKIQQLAFGNYNRRFANPQSPNAWVCSDTAVVARYDADPLCNFIFTANGFYNLFGVMQDAYSRDGWQMAHPQMPVWFISGADDPCLISPRKFAAAIENMRKVGYTDVTARLYPDMRHEILNETEKQTVWDDIAAKLREWGNNN